MTFQVTLLLSVFISSRLTKGLKEATTGDGFPVVSALVLNLPGVGACFIWLICAHFDLWSPPRGPVPLSPPLTDAHLSAQVSPAWGGAGENERKTDAPTLQQHKGQQAFLLLSWRCELHLLPLRLLHPAAVALCFSSFELVSFDHSCSAHLRLSMFFLFVLFFKERRRRNGI